MEEIIHLAQGPARMSFLNGKLLNDQRIAIKQRDLKKPDGWLMICLEVILSNMLGPFWKLLKFWAGIHPWTGNLCWSCSAIRKQWDRMKPDEMLHWRCSCVVDCAWRTCYLFSRATDFEASFPEVEQWKHVETQYPRCCPWHAPSSPFPSSVSSWWAMSPGWEALSW